MAIQYDHELFEREHIQEILNSQRMERPMSSHWTSTTSTATDPYGTYLDRKIDMIKLEIMKEKKKPEKVVKPIYHFDPEELVTK